MDKLQIAEEIGRLDIELAKAEALLREQERRLHSAKRNRIAGAAALLMGIVGYFFLYSLCEALWGLVAFVGMLTFLTAIGNQRGAERAITQTEARISQTRGTLLHSAASPPFSEQAH